MMKKPKILRDLEHILLESIKPSLDIFALSISQNLEIDYWRALRIANHIQAAGDSLKEE